MLVIKTTAYSVPRETSVVAEMNVKQGNKSALEQRTEFLSGGFTSFILLVGYPTGKPPQLENSALKWFCYENLDNCSY